MLASTTDLSVVLVTNLCGFLLSSRYEFIKAVAVSDDKGGKEYLTSWRSPGHCALSYGKQQGFVNDQYCIWSRGKRRRTPSMYIYNQKDRIVKPTTSLSMEECIEKACESERM